jgi:hypothetical protein
MSPHIPMCIISRTFSLLPSFCLLDLKASFPLTQSTPISKLEKSGLTRIPSLIDQLFNSWLRNMVQTSVPQHRGSLNFPTTLGNNHNIHKRSTKREIR